MSMTSRAFARALAISAAAPIVFTISTQAAHAGPDTVYFNYAPGVDCAITGDGTVGCDLPPGRYLSISTAPSGPSIPVPFIPVNQVVINQPWLPAHPGFTHGNFTAPGGNPPMQDVKTGDNSYFFGGATFRSPYVDHASVHCSETGTVMTFAGLRCTNSDGHYFELFYNGPTTISMR